MRLVIKVIPNSSQNEVVGLMSDGTLKVKVTTAPVDGKANEKLIELLSKHFHCSKSAITIVGGKTSKRKIISIH
jgi:uncharacterized protein (TIGR00251 family)